MDFNKSLCFEHFFSSSFSFKSRVLSGIGVGVLASLLIFSLLFRLNGTPSTPSGFSWFFSITDPSLFLGHADNNSSTTYSYPSSSFSAENHDLGMTHFINFTVDANSSSGEPVLEKTHDGNSSRSSIFKNSTVDLDNSSVLVHQEPILQPTHDRVEQVIDNEPLELDNRSNKDDGMKRDFEKEEEDRSVQVEGSNNDDGKSNVSRASSDANSTNAMGELAEKCNIFNGRWVRDDRKPLYPAGSCPYIDNEFNCHKNGRPDDEFLKWRWQPNDCDIPSLNATDFLLRLKGKRLLFVGDSLNRNMWESLVCVLRHSVQRKERVYEASGSHDFKTKGYYSFRFEDYNCSVDFVRSTFLVREIFLKNANGSDDERLRLDLLDETTSAYREADIIVFNTGHWWTHEKTSRGIDYYQEGDHVYPVLKAMEAYKKALTTWARWVDKNINSSKTEVVFRGYSLTHFRGGQWNSGGQCHKETEPIFNETFLAKYPLKMRALERVLDQMKMPVIYLNISRLTDYRKDGHPSIYRKTYKTVEEQIDAEQSQDCSHWCLPGIPDTWNGLLYASLLLNGKGSWTR